MSVLEITLLVLGLIAFFVSFFIPDKQVKDEIDIYTQDEIKNLIDIEIEKSKDRIADSADETINYSIEKAERSLERISNEKMIALGEYSDSVMTQINKNHKETVFLSDMLTKSKNDLTILLGQAVTDSKTASELAKKAIDKAQNAENSANQAINNAKNANDMVIVAEEKILAARKTVKEQNTSKKRTSKKSEIVADDNYDAISDLLSEDNLVDYQVPPSKKSTTKNSAQKKKSKEASMPSMQDGIFMDNDGQISLKFDADEETSKNSNDKVLKLHKQGKSNVAIAKELGLGIGEVKLVIDLFENKKK